MNPGALGVYEPGLRGTFLERPLHKLPHGKAHNCVQLGNYMTHMIVYV